MNATSYITKEYENKYNWTLGENKPNQTQFQRQKNASHILQPIFLLNLIVPVIITANGIWLRLRGEPEKVRTGVLGKT